MADGSAPQLPLGPSEDSANTHRAQSRVAHIDVDDRELHGVLIRDMSVEELARFASELGILVSVLSAFPVTCGSDAATRSIRF
jgi:hypothetical protein